MRVNTSARAVTATARRAPWSRGSTNAEAARTWGPVRIGLLVAVVAAVPCADHFLPADIHLAHILIIPVALAAAFAGPRRAAVVSLLAVMALVAAGVDRESLGRESVIVELGALLLLAVLMVSFSSQQERRRREVTQLRRVSDAATGVVLRPLPRRAGAVSIASAYRVAESGTRIGGDLYAVARTTGSTRVLIGDVRGKGLRSIADAETVLGAFRAVAHRPAPLSELVGSLENSVQWGVAEYADAQGGQDTGEHFVTAAILDIPDDEPVVRLVSCGHLPPLRLHGERVTALEVPESAPPLGLGGLAGGSYAATTFPFDPGDRLVLYTDGVTEARDQHGGFYPLLDRVAGWLDHDPEQLARSVSDDVTRHVAGVPVGDDVAVVVLRRER